MMNASDPQPESPTLRERPAPSLVGSTTLAEIRPIVQPAGTVLFRENNPDDRLFVILKGSVAFVEALGTDDERIAWLRYWCAYGPGLRSRSYSWSESSSGQSRRGCIMCVETSVASRLVYGTVDDAILGRMSTETIVRVACLVAQHPPHFARHHQRLPGLDHQHAHRRVCRRDVAIWLGACIGSAV